MERKDRGIPSAARRFQRFARRAAVIAALAIILPVLGFGGHYSYQVIRTESESGVLAPEETLIESFYLVAHTSDHGDPAFKYPAQKWGKTVPVYFHPSMPAWHRRMSERQIEILSRISGIHFQLTDTQDADHGLSFFYAEDGSSVTQMARDFKIDADRLRLATCFATYKAGDDRTIAWGIVVFRRPPEERRTLACIVEETVQVLGLEADRATYFPTVFTNDQARPAALSLNDMILLRALYDPAIKSGMTLEQTRTLIPGIIRRLVTGVKARGEQALYQN
ncbi:MAG: DUF2927 domain-containing protein [Rhodospirillales bacterium]